MVISVPGLTEALYKKLIFSAIDSRSGIHPGIGAYWLYPLFIAWLTSDVRSLLIGKSGKPWPRFTALVSVARPLITVKMVVPTFGSFDRSSIGNLGSIRQYCSGFNLYHILRLYQPADFNHRS